MDLILGWGTKILHAVQHGKKKKEKRKKNWYIYTMEYYPAMKKNEIMLFATNWMDLEIIILSEVNHTEEDKYHMISLILESNFKK